MKKIINGKVYDTSTAKRVGSWDNGHYTSDFQYCSEDLYQKKTGEFFLHCEGGAMSCYASHSGNSSGYGEQIQPITYEKAQKWAEDHLDGDEYCEIFGEPDEDAEDEKMTVRLSAAAAAKLAREAAKNGITKQAQLERWILGADA